MLSSLALSPQEIQRFYVFEELCWPRSSVALKEGFGFVCVKVVISNFWTDGGK
jgi:nitrate reductase NapE component